MALTIKQEATFEGDGWWSWAVWLDGDATDLARVESVTYHLHPTFPNPRRRVTDADSQFRLESAGWGEFTIVAKVEHRDGPSEFLQHYVELGYPEGRAPAKEDAPTVVFVSHSVADKHLVEELSERLRGLDVVVTTADDFDPGLPLESSLQSALEGSDALLVVESDSPSAWVNEEVTLAEKIDLPILSVRSEESSDPTATPRSLPGIQIGELLSRDSIAAAATIQNLLSRIR